MKLSFFITILCILSDIYDISDTGGLTPNETLSLSNGKFVFDHGPIYLYLLFILGLWKPTGYNHGGLGMFPGRGGLTGGRGRGGFRGGRRSLAQFPVPPLPPGVSLPPIEPSAIKVK